MGGKICLVAVIPTYKEAGTIVQVLSETLQHVSYVVVVDDGSPDGTGVLVEEMAGERDNVILINRGGKRGLGSAYKTGFRGCYNHYGCRRFTSTTHDTKPCRKSFGGVLCGRCIEIR